MLTLLTNEQISQLIIVVHITEHRLVLLFMTYMLTVSQVVQNAPVVVGELTKRYPAVHFVQLSTVLPLH